MVGHDADRRVKKSLNWLHFGESGVDGERCWTHTSSSGRRLLASREELKPSSLSSSAVAKKWNISSSLSSLIMLVKNAAGAVGTRIVLDSWRRIFSFSLLLRNSSLLVHCHNLGCDEATSMGHWTPLNAIHELVWRCRSSRNSAREQCNSRARLPKTQLVFTATFWWAIIAERGSSGCVVESTGQLFVMSQASEVLPCFAALELAPQDLHRHTGIRDRFGGDCCLCKWTTFNSSCCGHLVNSLLIWCHLTNSMAYNASN